MSHPQHNIALPEPAPDQAFIHVSALEAGMIRLPLQIFVKGATPEEISDCPSLAFLLRHSKTGTELVFDLGLRRDSDSYPPAAQALLKRMPIEVPQSVDESLVKGGKDPKEVQTVVLSHLHFDQ